MKFVKTSSESFDLTILLKRSPCTLYEIYTIAFFHEFSKTFKFSFLLQTNVKRDSYCIHTHTRHSPYKSRVGKYKSNSAVSLFLFILKSSSQTFGFETITRLSHYYYYFFFLWFARLLRPWTWNFSLFFSCYLSNYFKSAICVSISKI